MRTDAAEVPRLPFESMREDKRRLSNKQRVLQRLEVGPATNSELNEICFRYGARILELRREGWIIDVENDGGGWFTYRLRGRKEW